MPFRPEDKPRGSIITIMYNGRTQLLKKAVQSVINQSYPYWELILQDDHSTDGTYEMAVGLAMTDKRIKVYRNKKNLGISKNRLEAFKNTTGDLIAHLDNDDFLYPDAVKLMVDAFERNSEIGFAYSAALNNFSCSSSYLFSAAVLPSKLFIFSFPNEFVCIETHTLAQKKLIRNT